MRYQDKSQLTDFTNKLASYLQPQPFRDVGLRISFANSEWEHSLLELSLLHDAQYATGSILSVFVLMLLQTRSFAISILGFVHIVLSLPFGYFFYRVVLGQDVFGFLNGITLFIIMGIGADDVFVFFDAWRQSVVEHPQLRNPDNELARMQHVLGKSISAMSVTSFSTAAAFAATAVSPVPALRTFGIFCGATVCANFFFVITYFPAVVLIWSKRFEKSGKADTANEYRCTEIVFEKYGRLLAIRRVRRSLLLVFTVAIGALAVMASHLPKPVAMPMLYPPDHNFAINENAHSRLLQGGSYPIYVHI